MAILSKPSRSYASVDHDPNGLSEAGSVPYSYKHELKTFRPRKHLLDSLGLFTDTVALSETHLKRPGGLEGHHGSSFSPLPSAFLSSRQRKQQQEEGRRAEAEHMLDPDFRSTSNFSLDDNHAGPSRKGNRTAGGMLGGSVMRGTSSLSNFKGPGKKSQLSAGVYVDAEGKMHDTEFDPFAAVAEMTRNKSRRRSAFGSERKRGSDSDSTSSEESVDKSGARPVADAKRNEEALRQRRDSERKRFEDISGQAMKRRQSILSQRSVEGGRATPSLKSTEEGPMSVLQHYHLDRLNNRTRSSQGSLHQGSIHRSPLSPTFGHSPSSPLPTVADTDERPEKSTETTSMPPPAVPKSKVEIKPGGTKKVTGFDAPESPHPTIQTPRSASHLALSPARMSTSSRASRASTETAGERTKPPERPREEIFPETPAQTKKREERQRRQARLGYGAGSSSTRLMDNRAASTGARVLPEIEILADDDPRVVIPTDGRSTRLQTKYTQADHVIRPFASASLLDRPSSLRSVGFAGSGTKAPSEILDEGHGGYVPTRWAKGDKMLRVTEDDKERYRPKEWGGKTGDLAGKPEEWRSVFLFGHLILLLTL